MKREFDVDEESGQITMTVDGKQYGFIDPHMFPSYFTYKAHVLKFVICCNYDKLCDSCHEPECDAQAIQDMIATILDPLKKARAVALVGYFLIEGHNYTSIEQLVESIRKVKGEG